MVFTKRDPPRITFNGREECVGIGECAVDMRDVELVQERKEVSVDLSSANDERFLVRFAEGKCLLWRRDEDKGCGG